MKLHFFKYQGCGNDFIIFDNRTGTIQLKKKQIKNLCDRHFGIGADGLMLLEYEKGYDFKMIYYNSDGNVSSLCGNGSRCITAFAQSLNIIKDKARFLAADGEHHSVIPLRQAQDDIAEIALKMNDVNSLDDHKDFIFLNTGSPHVVKWVRNLKDYDVLTEGRKIRRSEPFNSKGGTNVNFAEQNLDGIFIRTYERGVENETLACGTGVTAAALVAAHFNKASSKNSCKVKTLGGNLSVSFHKNKSGFTEIWLKGPAQFVFEGEIVLK
jgi:diaminopimelate epimerase